MAVVVGSLSLALLLLLWSQNTCNTVGDSAQAGQPSWSRGLADEEPGLPHTSPVPPWLPHRLQAELTHKIMDLTSKVLDSS